MEYEEWLECLEILKKKNDQAIKEKLLNEPVNENLRELLEPKIIDCLKYKFQEENKKIVKNIYTVFSDSNMLDLYLVGLKKGLKFIDELTYIKELSEAKQKEIRSELQGSTAIIYGIILDEIQEYDDIGLLAITVKNNMYKWSDENEL